MGGGELTRSATARSFLAGVAAAGVLVLGALPARAGVTDPPTGVVDQATDAVSGVVDQATDAVSGVTGDVADTASDATGGATDPVTEPVQDVVDEAGDAADETTGQVEETVDDTARPVDDVVDEVDDATGGVIGDVTGRSDEGATPGRGPGNHSRRPADRSLDTRAAVLARRSEATHRGSRTRSPSTLRHGPPNAGSNPEPGASTAAGPIAGPPSLGERLAQAAIDASKQLAIPLGLTLVVLGFVVAQHWADRKDPKLVHAPVESDYDLLSFQ